MSGLRVPQEEIMLKNYTNFEIGILSDWNILL